MRFQYGLTCGHCGRATSVLFDTVDAPVVRVGVGKTGEPVAGYAPRAKDADGCTYEAAVGRCTWCAAPTLLDYRLTFNPPSPDFALRAKREGYPDGTYTFFDVRQFPQPAEIGAPADWPPELVTAWTDLMRAREAALSAQMLVTIAGTCMQVAMRKLDAKKGQIGEEIDDLHKRNVITNAMKDWAHHLRLRRNKGAHDFIADPEDVEEGIEFLRLFLHLTFTLRLQMEAKVVNAAKVVTA